MRSEFFKNLPEAKARAALLDVPCSVLPSTLEDVFSLSLIHILY